MSRLVFILISLFASPISHAFTEQLAHYLRTHQTEKAYQWLIYNQESEANNPEFNDWLAQLAMQLGDYPQAINALERLILLQPNHLGAQLDLVLAYLKSDDLPRARREFELLKKKAESLPQLPPHVAQAMQQLKLSLANPSNYSLSGIVQVGAGYDSNVNQGADSNQVRLNLEGQIPAVLELDPRSVASEDYFSDYRVQLSAKENSNSCTTAQWCKTLVLDFSTRLHQEQEQYNQYQTLFAGTLSQIQAHRRDRFTTYLQHAELSDSDTLSTLAAEFNQRWRWQRYWLGYALFGNTRHEADSTLPDSQQGSFTLLGESDSGWHYSWTWGYHNQPERHSGNTRRSYAALGYKTTLANWYAHSQLSFSWEQDTQPYNQDFFGKTIREDKKTALNIRLSHALSNRWLGTFEIDYSDNNSNIPLFDRDRLEANIGLSYLW